jgi:hypothetical protein
LCREFAGVEFKDGESVVKFSLRITTLTDNLRTLGDDVRESEVVKKLLQVVPEYLEQAAVTCEMILDLNATLVEEVTSRLCVFECRHNKNKPPTNAMGRLMLTKDEWTVRDKVNREQGGPSTGSPSSSGGRNTTHGKPHGRGGARGSSGGGSSVDSRPGTNSARSIYDDVCKACGKRGHWSKDYRSRPTKEQAHVAQDDEQTLLLVEACVDFQGESIPLAATPPRSVAPPTVVGSSSTPEEQIHGASVHREPPVQEIHLVEQKVFTTVGEEEDPEPRRWVLDTGATNHMTRSRVAFVDLDTSITRTVHFGNSSMIRVEGCNIILFACKTGECKESDAR